MNKPFKFRYVNEIVGVFVLVVVAALIVGIILAGRAQEWFVPVHHLVLDFPEEGSLGLQKGAEVQILGTPVGVVSSDFEWSAISEIFSALLGVMSTRPRTPLRS